MIYKKLLWALCFLFSLQVFSSGLNDDMQRLHEQAFCALQSVIDECNREKIEAHRQEKGLPRFFTEGNRFPGVKLGGPPKDGHKNVQKALNELERLMSPEQREKVFQSTGQRLVESPPNSPHVGQDSYFANQYLADPDKYNGNGADDLNAEVKEVIEGGKVTPRNQGTGSSQFVTPDAISSSQTPVVATPTSPFPNRLRRIMFGASLPNSGRQSKVRDRIATAQDQGSRLFGDNENSNNEKE